jgi:thioredoxin-like negative regulator of GroEL
LSRNRWDGSAFILKKAVTETNVPTAEELCQRGIDLLAAGTAAEAAEAFRTAIAADSGHVEAHHGLVRALRDAGRLEQSVGAALALTALTPGDPLAHTALSISLQHAGHVLEWKIQLQSPAEQDQEP